MENRKLIFSTSLMHEAQILKDRLEAEGVSTPNLESKRFNVQCLRDD